MTSVSNPANVRRVRYCLQTTGVDPRRLHRVERARRAVDADPAHVGRDAGAPADGAADGGVPGHRLERPAAVADYLANVSPSTPRPLFRYSSATGAITATDDAAREPIIRVEADLFVDPDTTSRPREAHVISSVVLRNQNRAPIGCFS